jgi:hypothetical protein
MSKVKTVFKRIKNSDHIWHPDSTLVFKSPTDRVVIGRYESGDIIDLDEQTLELCIKFKFKYDPTLVEEVKEEEEEEVKEVEEEEEKEVEEEEEKEVEEEEIEEKEVKVEEVKEEEVKEVEEEEVKEVEEEEVKEVEEEEVKEVEEEEVKEEEVKEVKDVIKIKKEVVNVEGVVNDPFITMTDNYVACVTELLCKLRNEIKDKNAVLEQRELELENVTKELNTLKTKFDDVKKMFGN